MKPYDPYKQSHRPAYNLDTIATLCAACDDYWPCRYAKCHTSPTPPDDEQDGHNEVHP